MKPASRPSAATGPVSSASPCPCGSSLGYGVCCGPLHAFSPAKTAEALMRSRFSAFVLGLEAYVAATWHPTTRPEDASLDKRTRWQRLEVLRHEQVGLNNAIVEFVAHYTHRGKPGALHEVSLFSREQGRWYYVDGEFPEAGNPQ